ncbi:MAG: VCBS repeat-containing protein [Saprospiraceae bacterium]|nr:VCBS repeat-containing protein [Saprospiraceae bacterium]
MLRYISEIWIPVIFIFLIISCLEVGEQQNNYLFENLSSDKTGLDFSNDLPTNVDLNILNYMYYYNGGGLAAADLNNDDLIDLVFSSNLGKEKIFINKGALQFEDISTNHSFEGGENAFSTGISIVDINNDGLFDIYLCQVGNYRNLDNRNKLFICTGLDENNHPVYEEKAEEYGLDFKGFSTQAGFFDYDLDGDLDMYLMNHSLHHNGTFGKRSSFLNSVDSVSGDRLYRNDGISFTDVSREAGIYSNVIGYGLGLAFGDINFDGYPDIYVGNDFHENDYLYINNGDGTFTEDLTNQIMHTSRFSMGVDIADLNNDIYPEIISLDMLPEDPVILKRSEGEDALDIFRFKLGYGYNHQYARNNLQLNKGNNSFKEIAAFSEVHATDWSWSPLIFDFNMDGKKDIFITNGIPKRMNDIDYINFISGNEIQYKIQFDQLETKDLGAIEKIPEIKIKNKFYLNDKTLKFLDAEVLIRNDKESYSNSAIYADLDNDGDQDVVCNNINQEAFLYKNLVEEKTYHKIKFEGPGKNKSGIGTKVIAYQDNDIIYYENYTTRGFQSCMYNDLLIPVSEGKDLDSIIVIWYDGKWQKIDSPVEKNLLIKYTEASGNFDYQSIRKKNNIKLKKITSDHNLDFAHEENPFVEFNREPLIPHSTSSDGPALAVGDLNGDKLDDIYIGSSKRRKSALFFQTATGIFERSTQEALEQDSIYEETDARIIDLDNDGDNDLIIATGGNEYRLTSQYTTPLIYWNNNGELTRKPGVLDSIHTTSSCILVEDVNNDGFADLFIGGRAVPWSYGEVPESFLLINDQNGSFINKTEEYHPDLSHTGMINGGCWTDINGDGKKDLVLALEWDRICAYIHNGDSFSKQYLSDESGWWNFIQPVDIDNDGDTDLIAGNLGLNSRLKASKKEPVRLYHEDFDNNGSKEQVLSYFSKGKEIPFSNMMELHKQIPLLKKKFIYANDFANADLKEIFGKDKIASATKYEVDYFSNAVLINNGEGRFKTKSLPAEAQFSSYHTSSLVDLNNDGLQEIFLGGNYYDCNIQMGRYDADYGSILFNHGNENLEYIQPAGDMLKNQLRKIKEITLADGTTAWVIAVNNQRIELVKLSYEE